jgi:hypothetical protein
VDAAAAASSMKKRNVEAPQEIVSAVKKSTVLGVVLVTPKTPLRACAFFCVSVGG